MEIRPIPNLLDYGASRCGRIFRLWDIDARTKAGEMTQHLGKRGYYVVIIDDKFIPVHRLVALAFLPNPEDKPVVAHRNGKRTQNNAGNLRWSTYKENSDDMPEHGTLLFGEAAPCVKLRLEQVREIQNILANKRPRAKPTHRDIGDRYGVTRECITRIANGDRWIRATAS